MRTFALLWLAFACLVMGDVSISQPATGKSYLASGGDVSVELAWVDDGGDSTFNLKNYKSYTISICTGPNSAISCPLLLKKEAQISDKKYTASIDSTDLPNGYYYFQIYTVFKEGITIHYSNRFQLKNMEGSTKTLSEPVTATGLPPGAQTPSGAGGDSSINSASFSVTYTKQTGKTRFAPMQSIPGSKITKTTWSRRFPTSAVTHFSTNAKSPNVYSTITPGWSFSITSDINYASIAPYPSYFYNPSSKVKQASLSSASKSKRWLD
ncbi:uncharacterized protein PRCAT00000439001 [Priceomyces carsonii]|uniref:uncharacterized protein n=1 Tax=Priceomyces carsonii TaxID=28549 RepID=UPI002ED994F8|nr:unnamed protein product [Priceomyces carsonii]